MSHPQRRVDPRLKVTIRARLRDSRRDSDICIIDVSARGLLAMAGTPPPRGEFVEIRLGPSVLVGQVRWASERRFGIGLQERIDVTSVARGDFSNFRTKVTSLQGRGQQARRPELAAEQGRRLANGLIAAACLGAGFFLANAVSENLGSLGKAAQAMSQGRAAPDRQ